MNNPIMALAQMAMNRISSDPSFQKNPQARAFMGIMQRGDVAQGQQMANYDICMMREKLMSWTKEAMSGNPPEINAQELGEVVDMIKDTYEMEYYCAKRKYYEEKIGTMEEYGDNERFKMGRSGMMRVLPENEYRFDPNEYDMYARMGYSGHKVAPSEMGRNWDKYLDARRHYNATKSDADRMEMSTSAKMHIGETIATLRDMWHDADPDLREKMKKDFSALLQEMN